MVASVHGAQPSQFPSKPVAVAIGADRLVKKDGYLSPLSTVSLACTEQLLFGQKLTGAEFSTAEKAKLLPQAAINAAKDLEITLSPELCEHMQARRDDDASVTQVSDKGLKELTKYGPGKQLENQGQRFTIPAAHVQTFLQGSLKLPDAVFKELEKLNGKFPAQLAAPSQMQAGQQKVAAVIKAIPGAAAKSVITAAAPGSAALVQKAAAQTLSATHTVASASLASKTIVQTNKPTPPPLPSLPPAPGILKTVQVSQAVRTDFGRVASDTLAPLQQIALKSTEEPRTTFNKTASWKPRQPVLSCSKFVTVAQCKHLMANKKDLALGVKFKQGDAITNMEGALHTYLTPVVPITMTGDYAYKGSHTVVPFANSQGRQVVMSAAIHPDFEKSGANEVMMQLCEITADGVKGALLPAQFADPTKIDRANAATRAAYDKALKEHMVYHLTGAHALPKLADVKPADKLTFDAGKKLLEDTLLNPAIKDPTIALQGKCIELNGKLLSLEVLYRSYLEQARNELSALDALLPQKYVYTIDPPRIFATAIGVEKGPLILNRLQALAFKQIAPHCKNLKMIGFNDFADPEMTALMGKAIPTATVVAKSTLFDAATGFYKGPAGCALVVHNNSDAFGQNIEHEPSGGSIDGAIGAHSDASKSLSRTRPELSAAVT